jgi:hypothetical protein
MVDLKKIDVETLQRHLKAIEPDLMASVAPEKAGVLCAGACNSLQQPNTGRGR